MSISERAIGVRELPARDRPISEQFRLVAREWADQENAAHILEELKTTTLEQRKSIIIAANPGLAENKAERLAKASPEWEQYIRSMCEARGKANLLRQKMKYIEMRHREWIAGDANARAERKL